jgi:hypothetical protein
MTATEVGWTVIRKEPDDSIADTVVHQWHPDIPSPLLPETRELISECLAMNPEDGPSFSNIRDRLEQMQFKVVASVNSKEVAAFVKSINQKYGIRQ